MYLFTLYIVSIVFIVISQATFYPASESYDYNQYCTCHTVNGSTNSSKADAANWIVSITAYEEERTFESKSLFYFVRNECDFNPGLILFYSLHRTGELRTHSLRHVCSAVVLNDYWLLSTSDCVVKHSLQSLRISYGQRDLYSLYRFGYHKLSEIALSSHPDSKNGLALLRLAEPIKWTNKVRPACLAQPLKSDDQAYDFSQNEFHAYSWVPAIQKFKYQLHTYELQTRTLDVVPVEDESYYKMQCLKDINRFQCTRTNLMEQITCYHNRGSPLVQTRNGVLTLSAVTLYAEGSQFPTKAENPTIMCSGSDFHARILPHMSWIQAHIGTRSCFV